MPGGPLQSPGSSKAPPKPGACCSQELGDIKTVRETARTEKHSVAKNFPDQVAHMVGKGKEDSYITDTHVMPISFRSLSVRVRKMRRSTSCSSNTCRYFRHPICSRNVARSCSQCKPKTYLPPHKALPFLNPKHYHSLTLSICFLMSLLGLPKF